MASGCSEPPAPAEQKPELTATRDAAIVADFQHDLGAILAAADGCRDDRSDACLARVLADGGNVTGQSGVLRPNDWLTQNVNWVRSLTKQQICQKMAFAIPYTRTFTNAVRIYFVLGVTAGGGAGVVGSGGAEAVWELNRHQAAAFTFTGLGVGNVAGGSAGAYSGVAISGLGGDIIGNWSGRFITAQVGLSIPETDIGIDIYNFRDTNVTTVAGLMRGVQGMAVGASVGVNFLNPAVSVTGGSSVYHPHDDMTVDMNGRGALSYVRGAAGNKYRQFNDSQSLAGYRLTAGGLQALDILWYGASLPQILAALTAYGIDKLNESGLGLAAWCGQEVAALPCGAGDTSTASFGTVGGVHPRACGAALDPVEGDPAISAPSTSHTACGSDAECTPNAVCTSNAAGTLCCRETFAAPDATACYSDADCATGEICSRGAKASSSTIELTCIDPKKHPCSDGKP